MPQGRRETWQVRGDIEPGSKLRAGLLALLVSSAPERLPAGLAGSVWEGMSGAVVFATDSDEGELAVGVVSTHHRAEGGSALTQVAALLPVLERVLGPEHPKTLAARSHLARWD